MTDLITELEDYIKEKKLELTHILYRDYKPITQYHEYHNYKIINLPDKKIGVFTDDDKTHNFEEFKKIIDFYLGLQKLDFITQLIGVVRINDVSIMMIGFVFKKYDKLYNHIQNLPLDETTKLITDISSNDKFIFMDINSDTLFYDIEKKKYLLGIYDYKSCVNKSNTSSNKNYINYILILFSLDEYLFHLYDDLANEENLYDKIYMLQLFLEVYPIKYLTKIISTFFNILIFNHNILQILYLVFYILFSEKSSEAYDIKNISNDNDGYTSIQNNKILRINTQLFEEFKIKLKYEDSKPKIISLNKYLKYKKKYILLKNLL